MYSNKKAGVTPYGTLGTAVITSTGVLAHRYVAMTQLSVTRIALVITTTVSSSANAVVKVKARPTIGSSSGEIVLGTLNIATGTAAASVVYVDVNDPAASSVLPGYEICADVTTAATSAGAGLLVFECEEDPEVAANQANMVASS
jgi:hypothetical protein